MDRPTAEQMTIMSMALVGSDLSIEALAGTGKTSTLRLFAEEARGQSGQYIAFNRSIAHEAKASFPRWVNCSTAHSLAFRAIGKRYAHRLNDSPRLSSRQLAEYINAHKFHFSHDFADHVFESHQIAFFASKTLLYFCKSLDHEIGSQHVYVPALLRHHPSLEEFSNLVAELARRIWEDALSVKGVLRFNHDYYLKMWQLNEPRISCDYILFDEAQDADPVMLDIVNRQSHAQLIYCGDPFQAIYEWRGAINALKLINVDERLQLTQSFRFGSAIAETANVFLTRLRATSPLRGFDSIQSELRRIPEPDAILCRGNAGVMSSIRDQLERSRRVGVIGGTQDLHEFLQACVDLQNNRRTGHPELAPFADWNEVLRWLDEERDDGSGMDRLVELASSFGPKNLLELLDQTVEENTADVVVSTVHRSKGREWDKVLCAGDFKAVDEMDEEDLMVAYVAVTRARDALDISAWTPPIDSPTWAHISNPISAASEHLSEKLASEIGTRTPRERPPIAKSTDSRSKIEVEPRLSWLDRLRKRSW